MLDKKNVDCPEIEKIWEDCICEMIIAMKDYTAEEAEEAEASKEQHRGKIRNSREFQNVGCEHFLRDLMLVVGEAIEIYKSEY